MTAASGARGLPALRHACAARPLCRSSGLSDVRHAPAAGSVCHTRRL